MGVVMVPRTWRGAATPENAPRYLQHLEVVTLWDSMEEIHAFAGPEAETAVVEPQARAVLSGFHETVAHYEVALRG